MTDFDHVKDSGERRSFGTGSVRDVRTGKGRYDLIPPIAIRRIAQHFENGAVKYGDKNWELGQPLSSYLDSGLRHTFNLLELKVDEDHAAAGIWNLIAFLCTADWIIEGRLPRDLDDIGYCDALEEAREDADLANLVDIGHAPRVFTGGGPADGPPEAPMVADYVGGIPPSGEQTTVLSREGAPEADEPEEYGEGWTIVETSPTSFFAYPPETHVSPDGIPEPQPLGEGWVDLGYLTDDEPVPYLPSWVPRTVEFDVAPLRQETIDLLFGRTPPRFEAGPPAETTDLAPFIAKMNEACRALAEQCYPLRAVAGIGTEDTMQALKDMATEAVPASAPYLQGQVTMFGLPVYEVDADDPALGGQPWAVVPESWAQRAVQRSLDRD